MSASFTPWSLGGSVHSDRKPVFALEECRQVCSLVSPGKSKKAQFETDARLIAAAPELYEALKAAAITFRTYESIHRDKGTPDRNAKADANRIMAEQCERALAKARGEQ